MIELISTACEWVVMTLTAIGFISLVGAILFIILREVKEDD